MKYPELKEPCKSCYLKCFRVEESSFTGDKNCKWQDKRQEKIKR